MRRVVLESPYAGDTATNVLYARACLLDCLARGESPIASHLLLTQVLNEDRPLDRARGMAAGHAWMNAAHAVVVYLDRGESVGMGEGMAVARRLGLIVEKRYMGGVWAS